MRGDFVDDMLLGRFTDHAELKRRAAYFHFKFEGDLRVLVADIYNFGRYIEQHQISETQAEEIKHALASTIEQCCREFKKITFIAPQGDRAVIMWPMRNPQTVTRLQQFAENLNQRMNVLWPDLTTIISVSTPITNPLRFADAYRECLDALAVAKRFNRITPIIIFDDLGIHALLLRNNAVEDLQNFAQRLLEPILAHERAEELLHTLDVTLRHQLSPQKSAEALFVHPNTVKYRLRKLRDLLHSDLSSMQDLLEIQLALLIYSLAPWT
jgi:sugar diacid utilization regulator